MAVLTRQQVINLAAQVGIPKARQALAGAICEAESGRRTDAVGVNPPDRGNPGSRDRGLWQINDYYHPDVSDACAFDPLCNARAMFRISSGGSNFTPWSTYNSNAYLPFMRAYLSLTGEADVINPAAGVDSVGTLVTRLRQGFPFWRAVMQAWETQVSLARAVVWDQQNVTTDLGSRLF